jgi:hypothetical protein
MSICIQAVAIQVRENMRQIAGLLVAWVFVVAQGMCQIKTPAVFADAGVLLELASIDACVA